MPNWCDSDLWVKIPRGKKADMEKAKERLQHFKLNSNNRKTDEDGLLDANCFIPYPKKFRDMDKAAEKNPKLKDGFNSGGYEWRKTNWGTKWGFCGVTLKEGGKELVYSFQTAWAPPLPLIQKMAEMYPELKFIIKYYEMGAGYKGEQVYENGELTKQTEGNYKGHRGG